MIKRALAFLVLWIGVATTGTVPAQAHASLQLYGSAATTSGYGVVFVRIGHGCTGGLATDTVVVSIPAGFSSVRPQQISGWTASRTLSGSTVTEVRWTGGSLPDSQFADFGISLKYPSTAGSYGFKVVQYCGAASATWDGANLPMLKVSGADTPQTAMVRAKSQHGSMNVKVDASSIYRGEKVSLHLASEGIIVRIMGRVLDEQGDLAIEIPLRGKNGKGSNYVLREGSTVTVKMGSDTIGQATMGASAEGGHH